MSKERNAIHKLSAGIVLNNRYEIIDLLGAGGFGNTYLARDTRFSATTLHVCVKEFFLSGVASRAADGRTIMLTDPTQAQNYEDGRLRFRREAERMFTLRDEHIVRVSDLFDENGTSYYVMDYIAGQSLAGLIQQRGALSESEALKYILQLLQGLRVIHSVGMVHLDIKPGNVMIDKSGKVVLIDFGASKIIENGSATLSAAILTTPGYAPLEQALCQLDRIGEWTDLYAVGGTLYKLLSGRTPATSQAIIDEGRSAFDFPAETSNATRELIFWLMNERISNRPHSTEEVITRVEALLEELKEGNHAAETPSASSDDIHEAIPLEPKASSPGEANIPLAEVAQPQQPAATPKAKATKAPQPLFTTPPPPGAQTFPPRNNQFSPTNPAAGPSATSPQSVPPTAAKPMAAPQGNATPTPSPAAPMATNQQTPQQPAQQPWHGQSQPHNQSAPQPYPNQSAPMRPTPPPQAGGMPNNPYPTSPFPIGGPAGANMGPAPSHLTPSQAGNYSSPKPKPTSAPSHKAPSNNGINVPPPPQGANAMGTNASQPPMAGSLDNRSSKGPSVPPPPQGASYQRNPQQSFGSPQAAGNHAFGNYPQPPIQSQMGNPPNDETHIQGSASPNTPFATNNPFAQPPKIKKDSNKIWLIIIVAIIVVAIVATFIITSIGSSSSDAWDDYYDSETPAESTE